MLYFSPAYCAWGEILFLILKKQTIKRIFAAFLIGLAMLFVTSGQFQSAFAPLRVGEGHLVVIDAGHGGEDGGAVAADGTVESGVNLEVALRLNDLLCFLGSETILTRSTDVSLHSPEAETLRQKKVSDLKNRVALINALEDSVLISVHQNSLPSDASVHGAQAFYAKTEGSDELAASIQSALNNAINAPKEKKEKAIYSGVYLMENVECTAVLVECGFLSNSTESKLLTQQTHQKKLAMTIAGGYLAWEMEREK